MDLGGVAIDVTLRGRNLDNNQTKDDFTIKHGKIIKCVEIYHQIEKNTTPWMKIKRPIKVCTTALKMTS